MPTRSAIGTRVQRSAAAGMLLVIGALVASCTTQQARQPPAQAGRSEPLTVARLNDMVQQGEGIGEIIGEIDRSGTVYRLTTDERGRLRDQGMPASVLSRMESTYDGAVRAHPELATSDERWIKIGDYWYGGVPAGWPRDWVTGATPK